MAPSPHPRRSVSAASTRSPACPSPYSSGRSCGRLARERRERGSGVEIDQHVPARSTVSVHSVLGSHRDARHPGQVGLLLQAARVGQRRRARCTAARSARCSPAAAPGSRCRRAASGSNSSASRSRAAVRGCSGSTTGIGTDSSSATSARAAPGRRRCRPGAPSPARTRPASTPRALTRSVRARARGWTAAATSTITSPTSSTAPATPSRRRFSTATSEEHSSSVAGMVGEHPVELLGHRAIERAHPGLHVGHRDPGLGGGQRARQRRVGVAVDEHRVGRDLDQHRLERRQHARGLRGVRPARDVQLALGRGQAELGEEHRRELVVEVLAGVDEHLLVDPAQRPGDTAAALMNCGRLPMTVRIFIRRSRLRAAQRVELGADALRDLAREPLGHRTDARKRHVVDRRHRLDLAHRRGQEHLVGGRQVLERARRARRRRH